MGMADIVLLLEQDKVWLDDVPLEELSVGHRTNLIPFLRGNAKTLQTIAELRYYNSSLAREEDPSDGTYAAQCHEEAQFFTTAEDWLERKPLMRKLVELVQGQSFIERKAIALRNKAHETVTGYRKIRYG